MRLTPFAAILTCVTLLAPARHVVELTVTAQPQMQPSYRMGVNLGVWTSWGAEQLSANVLKNPGFERAADGAMAIVQSSEDRWFLDDTPWLARPEGFWDGGTFSIRSGALAGREGVVIHSSVQSGVARLEVDKSISGLCPGDAVALRVSRRQGLPTQWWYSPGDGNISAEPGQRPGGEGSTVLRLTAGQNTASVSSFLDTIGSRAGKLLPVEGAWTLSLWVRADRPSVPFRVWLQRQGATPFLSETRYAGTEWQRQVWQFRANDSGPAGSLELRFELSEPGASLWLDDAELVRQPGGKTAFRREVEGALSVLHPGYLRDWQGQSGDSLQNRLAAAFERQPYRYRPGGDEATDYGYSLPDFLTLCEVSGAQPWVVLPATLNDGEWFQAGAYLSEQAGKRHFREILVEFGNENWNPVFRPAGIPDRITLKAAATRAFRLLAAGAREDSRILPVLGGNYFDTVQLGAIAASDPRTWLTGIAPYWAFDLQPGGGPGQLFADAGNLPLAVAASGSPAIYEMNASSLGGAVSTGEANGMVTSRAAGAALAWQAMRAMSAGITRQCAWSLAGFDTFGDGGRLVRLFGLTRDLAGGVSMRPTGMALAMLNRVAGGTFYPVATTSDDVLAVAFRSGNRWKAAICSRAAGAERVRLAFPAGAVFHGRAIALVSGSALDNNEDGQRVYEREIPATAARNSVEFELPAYGLVILSPARGEE